MVRLIPLLICFILAGGCAGDYQTQIQNAETLMEERPDSAYTIISSMNRHKIRGRKHKAKYALLYSQALDKNWIDVDNDSLTRIAVGYFQNHGQNIDKAKAFYYSGIVYYNASDIDEAMKAFVKARIYVDKTDDYYLKGLICSVIGDLYYSQYSFDEALQMYSAAIDAFSHIDNKRNLLLVLQNKGLILAVTNQIDDAIKCFSQAERTAWELDDVQMAIATIASRVSIEVEHNPSAIGKCKNELFDIYRKYTSNVVPASHYAIVGKIYKEENKIDSAIYFYTKFLDNCRDITFDNIGTLLNLSSLEYNKRNYKRAYDYEKLYSLKSDSLNQEQRDNLIQGLERKYKTEYLQTSYETLQSKRRYEILCCILAFAILGIMIWRGIVYFKRVISRRNLQLAEYQSYLDEAHSYYSELQDKYLNITKDARLQDERSQALLEVLNKRIESLKQLLEWASKYESNPEKFYTLFKEHMKLAVGKNRDLAEDVIAIANLMNGGIIDHLQKLYPSLSQHELCYCGFISLGFSHECIRILYNHTNAYSIYTMRSKIRGKIGLVNNSISLESYILDLIGKHEFEAVI